MFNVIESIRAKDELDEVLNGLDSTIEYWKRQAKQADDEIYYRNGIIKQLEKERNGIIKQLEKERKAWTATGKPESKYTLN